MMSQAPLPLYLDVHNARAQGIGPPFKPRRQAVTGIVLQTVFRRDFHTCHFCGFRSKKYQTSVGTGSNLRDPDTVVTACIFCHQCFHLEQIGSWRSGLLVWLPEMSQARLHVLTRELYVGRISRGPLQEKARSALESLRARGAQAEERLSSCDPRSLAEQMLSCTDARALAALRARLESIRLLPLDRRIIREADLEFNQFPQILAYWRSKDGPLSSQAGFASLHQVAEHGLGAFS